MKSMLRKKSKGFTFIEIIISVAILSILSTFVAALIFLILRSTSKTSSQKEIKQNGNTALLVIQEFIRKADSIDSMTQYCDGEQHESITMTSSDGLTSTFSCQETGEIASSSGITVTAITGSTVRCSDFFVSCTLADGIPLLDISFSLSPASAPVIGGTDASNFQGKVGFYPN